MGVALKVAKHFKFMKNILTILTLLILSSCNSDRICRRAIKHGCQKDTIKIEITKVVGQKEMYLDSNKLDSAVNAILSLLKTEVDTTHDTIYLKAVKSNLSSKIREIIKTIPCKFEPINEVTPYYDLRIWDDNGTLRYKVEPKIVTKDIQCPKIRWYQKYWWVWIIVGMAFVFLLMTLLMYILKSLGSNTDQDTH